MKMVGERSLNMGVGISRKSKETPIRVDLVEMEEEMDKMHLELGIMKTEIEELKKNAKLTASETKKN